MESPKTGIFGRLAERVLGWVALAGLIALGYAIYRLGPEGRSAIWSGIWRTIVWTAFAAVLPWSARLFIRRILEIGSNWAGVGLLTAFLFLDALAGLALLGGLPDGGWSWLATLAALALAGTYNFLVAEYLSEQAGV